MNRFGMIVGMVWYGIFFLVCYLATGTDKKNLNGFRSYPDEVQEKVYQDATLGDMAPKKISVPVIMVSNLLMFTVVFSILGVLLGKPLELTDFKTTFIYFLILGEGLNLFDLVVIELLWWRNSKRIRFTCVPDKESYRNPQKHMASFWRGIPMFAVIAVLTALICRAFAGIC